MRVGLRRLASGRGRGLGVYSMAGNFPGVVSGGLAGLGLCACAIEGNPERPADVEDDWAAWGEGVVFKCIVHIRNTYSHETRGTSAKHSILL